MAASAYIRRVQIGDESALFKIYGSAIHEISRHDYKQEQLDAWASRDLDQDLRGKKIRDIRPFVAEEDGDLVGYVDVQSSGYMDHFFVSGFRSGWGIGGMLMERIHQEAAALGLAALAADVSRTTEHCFWRYGFDVVE